MEREVLGKGEGKVEKRAKILLIDDDPDFVEATRKVLESRDYQVAVAYSGAEGLQKAMEDKPDVILLDIIMPAKDGFNVCEEFKESDELGDIPVLMLTSYSQRKGDTRIPVSHGFGLEAEDYIDKPVQPAVLIERIEKQLARIG